MMLCLYPRSLVYCVMHLYQDLCVGNKSPQRLECQISKVKSLVVTWWDCFSLHHLLPDLATHIELGGFRLLLILCWCDSTI